MIKQKSFAGDAGFMRDAGHAFAGDLGFTACGSTTSVDQTPRNEDVPGG